MLDAKCIRGICQLENNALLYMFARDNMGLTQVVLQSGVHADEIKKKRSDKIIDFLV